VAQAIGNQLVETFYGGKYLDFIVFRAQKWRLY
jgi:hypothetical protein